MFLHTLQTDVFMRRRRIVRPYGQSIGPSRIVSLLFALMILGLIYDRAQDPQMWRWFAAREEAESEQDRAAPAAGLPSQDLPPQETVVPGPNDQAEDQKADFVRLSELIIDRAPLKPREMLPYWKLIAWSRTESTRALEKRAKPEPAFTLVWEHPERYRGQLIKLRMHVRRVLEYEAGENDLGIKTLYEAWGWTEESKSFPYVVVFADKPPGLPVGNEVEADIVFSGYFFKLMAYTAFDNQRGAPLLIGRARLAAGGSGSRGPVSSPLSAVLPAVVGVFGIAAAAGWWFLGRPSKPRTARSVSLSSQGELPEFLNLGLPSDSTAVIVDQHAAPPPADPGPASPASEPMSQSADNESGQSKARSNPIAE